MNKQEFMHIWERVYDRNVEEITNVVPLTEFEEDLVVNTLTQYIKYIKGKE